MTAADLKRLIALLIGIATVVTGVFTWRAGQIGSAAAFDDRQAIGEQVDVEHAGIDVAVEAARQAREYDRYLTDYAVAEALDADADELEAAGDTELAVSARRQATTTRRSATLRASASGVFGAGTLARNPDQVATEPLVFDLESRIATLIRAEETGLDSASDLDPQQWADDADDRRRRIRNLSYWVALLLIAVVALTAAEVTVSAMVRRSGLVAGLLLISVGVVGGLTSGYFG